MFSRPYLWKIYSRIMHSPFIKNEDAPFRIYDILFILINLPLVSIKNSFHGIRTYIEIP